MQNKQLLCVARGRSVFLDGCGDALLGWDVSHVRTLRDAARALDAHGYLVGLLALDDDDKYDVLEQFLNEHWQPRWIGILPRRLLGSTRCRQLIGEHLCDFHTEPVDAVRLRCTLGHAHGIAMLRPATAGVAAAPLGLIGRSAPVSRLRGQIARLAGVDAPVLIWGESGSGKEVVAQAIHAASPRAGGPFTPINCGAIAPALIQSELFGHVRGAFTGAAQAKSGLIEAAAGGTLFLDEIADLPKDLQANLLRFLQEKTLYRVGSTHSIAIDTRVIAASHVDLQLAVAQGLFREDLYYRLSVLPLAVPPLRERGDDLFLLADHFFRAHAADKPRQLRGFSRPAMQAMRQHRWPGNVRELVNRIRRAMVLAEGRLITPCDLGLEVAYVTPGGASLQELRIAAECEAIRASMARAGSNITHAARELGISRMTLYRLLAKHGIGP